MYQEDTCVLCSKKAEEKLITVTSKGSNILKTYCRKRKATSLLKLIEECENSAEKKIKVSTIEELLFIVTLSPTKYQKTILSFTFLSE